MGVFVKAWENAGGCRRRSLPMRALSWKRKSGINILQTMDLKSVIKFYNLLRVLLKLLRYDTRI